MGYILFTKINYIMEALGNYRGEKNKNLKKLFKTTLKRILNKDMFFL